jgi:hypothetical protein
MRCYIFDDDFDEVRILDEMKTLVSFINKIIRISDGDSNKTKSNRFVMNIAAINPHNGKG